MISVYRGMAAAVCLAALAGCSADSLITGGELVRPGEPTGTLTVINGAGGNIDVVTISECSASTYGFDRLPEDIVIGPGQSHSFTVSAGCWDVDAGAFGVGEARQRLDVAAGGITEYTVTD
ncbi:MAG: hypothetical protein JWQ89_979 [Devosia sp.]|uniref:hypothetical protein n=1 Tax=Devosia sp. TaxID=1871048 RepID=UPI002621D587|nr:hypothetical protein [Devosia sp.]MDB5539252.1 hypothetical protein [Devosia sp.]